MQEELKELNELMKAVIHNQQMMSAEFRGFQKQVYQKFEQIDDRFDSIIEEMKRFQTETNNHFKDVDRRFEAIDKRFEAVEKRMEAVEKRMEAVEKRMEAVENKVEGVMQETKEHQEQNNAQFRKLHERLDKIEAQVWVWKVKWLEHEEEILLMKEANSA